MPIILLHIPWRLKKVQCPLRKQTVNFKVPIFNRKIMKYSIILFIFLAVTSVYCSDPLRHRLPFIEMIPTGVLPPICVTAKEELPPCGIGKFRQNQLEYEDRINKIRQSYVDMVIDFNNTKNGSVENYGPGKIYLESYESLHRKMEEKRKQNLTEALKMNKDINLSEVEEKEKNLEEDNLSEMEYQEESTVNAPSIIRIVRFVRSLDKTVIVATECIPLGVEFCDDFPRPTAYAKDNLKNIHKRSLRTIPEYIKNFWYHKSKYENSKKPKSVTDDLIEIYPLYREEFFNRVD